MCDLIVLHVSDGDMYVEIATALVDARVAASAMATVARRTHLSF
jgi:hypothetical protein